MRQKMLRTSTASEINKS